MKKQSFQELIDTYSCSTKIHSRIFKNKKPIIFSKNTGLPSFCKMVHQHKGQKDCLNSYLYAGRQAQNLGEAYIYFCPYGLTNWAIPFFEEQEIKYSFVGGPVLIHQVDNLLIKDICQQNPELKYNIEKMKKHLDEIEIVDTSRVNYLSKLLMKLSRHLMAEKSIKLDQKMQFNKGTALIGETIQKLKENKENLHQKNYPLKKEKDLIYHVKLGNRKKSREILNKILGIIYFKSSDQFSIVKARAIELMVVLARSAIEVGADLENIFGLEYKCLESINSSQNINQLSQILTQVLNRFIDYIFSITNVKNKGLIYKAMNYIRENHNNNIKLNDVAKHVGLSSSYFSNLFNEETGINYTEYLHQVRIETAKKFLAEGTSLADTAQKVGFNDQSYFSRIFKKIEGISPGKWKKNKSYKDS